MHAHTQTHTILILMGSKREKEEKGRERGRR